MFTVRFPKFHRPNKVVVYEIPVQASPALPRDKDIVSSFFFFFLSLFFVHGALMESQGILPCKRFRALKTTKMLLLFMCHQVSRQTLFCGETFLAFWTLLAKIDMRTFMR
jgi:hypothetical protein